MKRVAASLAFCALLGPSELMADDTPAEDAQTAELAGRCSYSNRLAPLVEQNHVLLECDRMILSRSANRIELTFAFPARLRSVAFAGQFEETGRLTVNAIHRRVSDSWDDAEGECQFDPAGSDFPVVTCIVKSRSRYFVANFTPES